MRNRSPIGPSRLKKLVLGAAALSGLGTPIVVGILNAPAIRAQDATDWQTRAGGKMAFDVASIKPSKGAFVPSNFPLDPSDDYGATNGRLTADGHRRPRPPSRSGACSHPRRAGGRVKPRARQAKIPEIWKGYKIPHDHIL